MSPETDNSGFPTDYEIAQQAEKQPIVDIVEPFGLEKADLELYGEYKAKLRMSAIERVRNETNESGKLILVTGMTPTPLGEGKTVTTVGLGQSFNHIGKDALICIREPSLGPVFGVKGGAAGGGYSQVLPMEDINLHFTGDLHALTSAHNLIAAMLDNHIRQEQEPIIDRKAVAWKRAIDMNDRALRETVIGLGSTGGAVREDGFLLTAASEVMAVLCLADGLGDLKARLARMIVGYDHEGSPVTVDDIDATGAATMLLRDAIQPNIVQTIEGTPAFVHGGPFANIAHGTNSLIADDVASGLADYLLTEAGFGSDLGAEKFMNIVCGFGDMEPDAVTLVTTVRALKYHGLDMWPADLDVLDEEDVEAVKAGFDNLDKHVANLEKFGVPVVIAINQFPTDTEAELNAVLSHATEDLEVRAAISEVFSGGGEGGEALAHEVVAAAEETSTFTPLYEVDEPIKDKIERIAIEIYGADGVNYSAQAEEDIAQLTDLGMDEMPICMSKTFHSLSDDPSKKGVPTNWELDIRELYPSAGAGFLVVLTGDVLTLPGLPSVPAAANMDIDESGRISGLF